MASTADTILGRFVAAARAYVDWIDVPHDAGPQDLFDLHCHLAELQASILLMDYRDGPEHSPDVMTSSEHNEIWRSLIDRLARLPIKHYWTVFSPLDEQEVVEGWFQDDLADIYLDLLNGLRHLAAGREAAAIWEWRYQYFNHWGHHLTNAQGVLRSYLETYGGSSFSNRTTSNR